MAVNLAFVLCVSPVQVIADDGEGARLRRRTSKIKSYFINARVFMYKIFYILHDDPSIILADGYPAVKEWCQAACAPSLRRER